MYYTLTKLYHDTNCWVIRINITWQWRHNCLSFKSNFNPLNIDLNFGNALRCASFHYTKFHRNLWDEFWDILKVLKNGYNLLRWLKTPTGRRHEPVGYLRALLRSWTAMGTVGNKPNLLSLRLVLKLSGQWVWSADKPATLSP